ncbi:MAG: hypothetical protein SGPRY_009039 [Prymnesium sp.]
MLKILKSKVELVDPNAERLTEHMANMKAEHLNAAVTELMGSRLRDVIKAKALMTHRILMVAMDDVQSQFTGGMRQVSTPPLSPDLSAEDIGTLCDTAIIAVRECFDASYTLPLLENELAERIQAQPAAVTHNPDPLARSSAVPTAEADPLGWLRALVLGAVDLPLGEEERYFLEVNVSTYLDPFMDGNISPEDCLNQSEGLFYDRLQRAWLAVHGDAEMRIPGHLAYAQYVTHCVKKLNANHGFGAHMPGLGRTPLADTEQELTLQQMSTAIIQATERDFDRSHRVIGVSLILSMARLTVNSDRDGLILSLSCVVEYDGSERRSAHADSAGPSHLSFHVP